MSEHSSGRFVISDDIAPRRVRSASSAANSERIRFADVFKATLVSVVAILPVLIFGWLATPVSFAVAFVMTLLCDSWPKAVIALLLTYFCWFLITPSFHHPRGPARRTVCLNNMRQIILAIHNYESNNGHFPPPYTVGEHGNRLHSWRVLILPYLDGGNLYDAIDLTKPWNDPVNRKFYQQMPDVYRCPENPDSSSITSYLAVVGDETFWRPDEATKFWDIHDGSSNTIAIIESTNYRRNWMNPNDVAFKTLLSEGLPSVLSSNHPGGAQVAFADGSARFISTPVDAEILKALFTIEGNEVIDPNSY